jgi:hypothetical protein
VNDIPVVHDRERDIVAHVNKVIPPFQTGLRQLAKSSIVGEVLSFWPFQLPKIENSFSYWFLIILTIRLKAWDLSRESAVGYP